MSAADKCESSASSAGLNESWVELNLSNKNSGNSTPVYSQLLMEAQKESGVTSLNCSGRNSTKGLSSPPLSTGSAASSDSFTRPVIPDEQLNEFLRDFSSRPEIVPPSDYGMKMSRPVKRHPLSVRNTRVIKNSIFSSEHLPTLLITHATSFAVGASLVVWCLKKSSGQ